MDTTSNGLAMTLMLLGDHPEAQQRLRAEVLAALEGRNELASDALCALPYLDAVCRETLRLYAPVTHVFREYVGAIPPRFPAPSKPELATLITLYVTSQDAEGNRPPPLVPYSRA